MADEMNGKKTRTIGKVTIAKLAKVKEWVDFEKKSVEAAKINAAHEAAKSKMRDYFKGALELDADMVIDFSKNTDGTLTIIEKLEAKKTKRATGSLLDDKL